MIKTLASANALEREKFRIPRSVQHSIPIKKIYRDGLWHSGNKHSCTWRFSDINYVSASDEDKRSIFMLYSSVINSLPTDAGVKISILKAFGPKTVKILLLDFTLITYHRKSGSDNCSSD